MKNYYSKSLNSSRLQQCYDIAPERVQQFLEAEINFVLSRIEQHFIVLDLGCGYGRVTTHLAKKAQKVIGIDISEDNIEYAKKLCSDYGNCEFHTMNACELRFENNVFDLVICVQNGISAFKVSPEKLFEEAIRVTKIGGVVLFSSYSEKFWNDRLHWFVLQAEQGLIGEIDFNLTKNGVIVCQDGFRANTYAKREFLALASNFNLETKIYEVDNSSLFCEMIKK